MTEPYFYLAYFKSKTAYTQNLMLCVFKGYLFLLFYAVAFYARPFFLPNLHNGRLPASAAAELCFLPVSIPSIPMNCTSVAI